MNGPGGLNSITRGDLAKHVARVASSEDEIYSPLYDSGIYTSGTTTTMQFFAVPQGQGATSSPGASGTKSLADTNMQLAGQLSLGNKFYATGIEFQIFPGINPGRGGVADATAGQFVNDTYLLAKSGVVNLRIQNRDYATDGPLLNFPPIARLGGFSAAATNLTAGAATYSEVAYASLAGNPYNIVPLTLESTQAFSLTVVWPAAVTLASATNARIFARLRGRLIRNIQ
jgi:hypothetical protein